MSQLTKDGLELAIATQKQRDQLGEQDVTVSIPGFINLCELALKSFAAPEVGKLTDEQIMSAACAAADALDATRVSEMRTGGWHATTIFDGDSGLLRFGRLIEQAVKSTRANARQSMDCAVRCFAVSEEERCVDCPSRLPQAQPETIPSPRGKQ